MNHSNTKKTRKTFRKQMLKEADQVTNTFTLSSPTNCSPRDGNEWKLQPNAGREYGTDWDTFDSAI